MSLPSRLLDIFLPPLCLHCGRPLRAARPGCCPACLAGLRPLDGAGCLTCGLPRPGSPGRCARCRDWPQGLEARAAVRYDGVALSMVRHLKYAGWLHLAETCALEMAALVEARPLDALVPVPLHPVRLRARGYNQARALAEALGRVHSLPVLDVLERVRATRPQVGLGRAARAANVEGAFACRLGAPQAVGLVDDVATSGATLAAAGTALLEAGALRVVGLAFALAPEDVPG
ncbi:MAG TPA: ComF family protein [Gemmatimonadota bacterium]|nr:ComF family protein [Gemmatimonadota bacterium]